MNLEIGSTLGDYQIIDVLGAGGMGKVYKVRNVISDRIEAMKVLLPDLANEPELGDRFMREIKVQASLKHPNIAALHTALRQDNQLLMLMEFVEGETLDQKLRSGPLPVAQAVDYISQVLAALGYAHQHGVIHRDIKPANMMLTRQGAIKLMDFGIAKASTDRKLTMTGTTMGSLYYMSPEQIKGLTALDARADLYSVGVSLYELVTGKRPFDGDSQFAIMSAHLEKSPAPPVTIDPTLPAALNDIILLAVGKEPDQRFQTAEAFRNALLTVAQPAGMPAAAAAAETVPMPPPAAAPARGGRRGLWLAVGALVTALAVVAVVQFGPWRKAGAAGEETPAAAAPVATTPTPAPVETPAAPVPEPPAAQPAAVQPAVAQPAAAKPAPAPAYKRGFELVKPGTAPAPARQAAPEAAPARAAQAPVVQQQQAAPPPAQQQAQPAVNDAAARRAELQQVREQLVMVASRAAAARNSLQNMQRSQAASGLGLRGDIVEAGTMMQSFLDGANAALTAGDAPAAKGLMEKAERQLDKVEKFLGR